MATEQTETGKPRAVRVKDVAQAAGVSVATVSRAFNFPGTVREEKHVLAVAHRLGYRPNPAAKALRLQRTYMVGAIFPTTDHGLYSGMLSSFQARMHQAGYLSVLITVGFDNSNIFEPVKQLLDRGIEGLMVVGRIDDKRLLAHLLANRIPVVSTYSYLADAPFPSVGANNYAGTARATEHLLALGHRHFAMLSGPATGNDRQQARRRAFADTLRAAGVAGDPLIFEDPTGYSLDFATRTFRELVQTHPEVTAIICNSDYYGLAVLAEAKKLGVRVPEQMSVVGYDDQDFAAVLDPALTTVSIKGAEMGAQAATSLLLALDGASGSSRELPATLIVRASTAPPP
ncbi:substrate-binding domain-containing protein [Variovorax sp. tm]|uniref:substrate-binding domain-containing protein n=1 Tax=Variovorax atrisoli TaxID=3394203 RepID=UPI003A80745F